MEVKRQLIVETVAVVNDFIYYSIKNGSGLYRYDIRSGSNTKVSCFRANIGAETELYNYAFVWNDKIFFSPYNACTTAIYDLTDNKIEYDSSYDEMFMFLKNKKSPLYFKYMVINNFVYIIGLWNEVFIYKMDMVNKNGHEIQSIKELSDKWLSLRNSFWDKNVCLIPSPDEDKYYELDVNTEQITVKDVPVDICAPFGIAKNYNCTYFLGGMGGSLYNYHQHEKTVEKIFSYANDNVKDGTRYANMEFANGKLYFVPEPASVQYVFSIYDINNKRMAKIDGKKKNDFVFLIGNCANQMVFYSQTYNKFITIEDESYLRYWNIEGQDEDVVMYFPNSVINEDSVWTLTGFVCDVLKED